LRERVAQRDRGRCRYCGLSQLGQAAVFHVNHVIPRSEGGPTAIDNLVTQCPSCSLHKSNKLGGVDPLNGQGVSLFHPLRQSWSEHFELHPDGTCVGRTAEGRVTVQELGMNDPRCRLARALQQILGIMKG